MNIGLYGVFKNKNITYLSENIFRKFIFYYNKLISYDEADVRSMIDAGELT